MVRRYIPDGEVLTEAFWDRSEFSIIQGPIGSGTSSMCSHKIMVMAGEQPPDDDGVRRTRWMVVRDTYPKLAETTQKTWLDWFPEEQFGVFRKKVPPMHKVRVPHPSRDNTTIDAEVIFQAIGSAEEAEAIAASYEITGFWINEIQFTEKGVVDELMSRAGRYPSPARGPGAKWLGGFADMNAPEEGHWIPYMRGDVLMPNDWSEERKQEFEKPEPWKFFMQPPGLIETMKEGRIIYLPNPKAENQKNLRQTYLQQAQGKPKDWVDRRVLNKTGLYTTGKPVYPSFVEAEHCSHTDIQILPNLPIIVGLDFGRDPAAIAGQCPNGKWRVFNELIGENEPAVEFAPRLKRWLSQLYPGHEFIFGGDPRGSERSRISNVPAYDVFQAHGMSVKQATSNNDPALRRNTVTGVLMRRDGLKISKNCSTLRTAMAGGYHFPKIRGTGAFREVPEKNRYSHPAEAFENMLLIGGEGHKVISYNKNRPEPVKVGRRRVKMRKFS